MKQITTDALFSLIPPAQLKELAAFGALSDDFLHMIINGSDKLEASTGTLLFEGKQYTDYFYTVIHGEIKIYKGPHESNSVINELHAGECVGFISMLCMTPFPGDAIVTEESVILRTSNELFASLPSVHGEQFSIYLINLARNIGRAYLKTIG